MSEPERERNDTELVGQLVAPEGGAGRREVLMVVHTGRSENAEPAKRVAAQLSAAGFGLRVLTDETEELALPGELGPVCVPVGDDAARGTELVLVLGGDGTFLRAAELARPAGVPVLGINLGHVGFLAEADPEHLQDAVAAIISGDYRVEERMTLQVAVLVGGRTTASSWALNEASLERSGRGGILEVVLEVDDRPVSGYGCDGMLVSTPTGSTAYAFSAGGPVVWPQLEALLVVPSNAHALFARPLVTSPDSVVAIELDDTGADGALSCDGRRTLAVPAGGRVEVTRGDLPVRVVRLDSGPFTDRLVTKFSLPVQSWRGRGSR